MKKATFFIFICFLALSTPLKIVAGSATQIEIEQRAKEIGKQLRCMVCQNQTIEDSDAPIANDLKKLVIKKLKEGSTDDEVISFIHERYGDFVLMNPPVQPSTYGLWFAPFIILAIGGITVFFYLKKQSEKSA